VPGAAPDNKFLRVPIKTFYVTQSFSPVIWLGFVVCGTPWSRGWVAGVIHVLRTFPLLVRRSVQNLVEIGLAVRAWKRDTGRYIYMFYIYRRVTFDYFFILGKFFKNLIDPTLILANPALTGVNLLTCPILTQINIFCSNEPLLVILNIIWVLLTQSGLFLPST